MRKYLEQINQIKNMNVQRATKWGNYLRGDTHITSTLRGGGGGVGGVKQKWDVIGRKWVGLASIFEVQSLFFLIKENSVYAMTRHHAEPNINILLTSNFPFNLELINFSSVRQWSHALMIPLHCLWAKLNNGTGGQFECDVT